jgi:hypothetical protein
MVLAQKQTWRPVEQKTQIYIHAATPTWFLTKAAKAYHGGMTACLANVAGKTRYLHAENWK